MFLLGGGFTYADQIRHIVLCKIIIYILINVACMMWQIRFVTFPFILILIRFEATANNFNVGYIYLLVFRNISNPITQLKIFYLIGSNYNY